MTQCCIAQRMLGIALAAALGVSVSADMAHAQDEFGEVVAKEFEKFDPEYRVHHEQYSEWLDALAGQIAEAELAGRDLPCSQQMYLEAKWLLGYTAHWQRLEDKLRRIEQSLHDHNQDFANEQSPVDGLWGICHEEWFMRMGATLSALESLAARKEQPLYRIRPNDRFHTGKALIDGLQGLLISDIANLGIDHRSELGSLITTFSQGVFKPHLRSILVGTVDMGTTTPLDHITEAFQFFLRGSQNPETGYWGSWYSVDGKIVKTNDLSMTYHVVAYSKGRVEHWPQILATTLAAEDHDYPYGWRSEGHFTNHNLYDVVRIFKYGWPHATTIQKKRIAAKVDDILRWSLANTVDEAGMFTSEPGHSDSLADDYYFGVSFLDAVGYWEPAARFWSEAPIDPELAGVVDCCRVRRKMTELDLEGWAAEGAMSKLVRNCRVCTAEGPSATPIR